MVQPFITAGQTITPSISVDADFQTQTQVANIQILSGGSSWDSAVWDTAVWFGSLVQTTSWLSADAIGHALAIHLTLNITTTGTNGTQALFDFSYFDQAEFDVGVSTTPVILQVNAFNSLLELGGFV